MAASGAELIDLCQETDEDRTQPCRNAYQAGHPPEVRVTGVGGSVMPHKISIIHDCLPLLDSRLEKIEKIYCVKISKDVGNASSNGEFAPVVQWISISGSKGDCKNAGVRLFSFYGTLM